MKMLSLLFFTVLLSTQLCAFSELHIKGIFLEKFTHLIEWPLNDTPKFTLCVINDREFAQVLEGIYAGKMLKNRPVRIVSLSQDDEVPECQLLFIGKETRDIKHILSKISGRAVLSVSDYKHFVLDGIMITMFLQEKRFSYIINNKAAQDENIRISYLLLKSAQEVIK